MVLVTQPTHSPPRRWVFEGVLEDLHGEFFVRKADWVADLVASARGGDIGGTFEFCWVLLSIALLARSVLGCVMSSKQLSAVEHSSGLCCPTTCSRWGELPHHSVIQGQH